MAICPFRFAWSFFLSLGVASFYFHPTASTYLCVSRHRHSLRFFSAHILSFETAVASQESERESLLILTLPGLSDAFIHVFTLTLRCW